MLAANGAKVVVNGRDEAAVSETVQNIRSDGGDATGITADAADLDALERLREETERVYGPVEVLGAFVAGGGPLPGPTAQITEPDWDAALRGTLSVTFLTLKTFLPHPEDLPAGDGQARSRLDHHHGLDRRPPRRRRSVGCSYRLRGRQGGSRAAHPGSREGSGPTWRAGQLCVAVDDPDRADADDDPRGAQSAADRDASAGRLGTPEDVAYAVLFLASESSSWITGVTLDVAGGQIMI